MKIFKRIIIAVVITAILGCAAAGGVFYIKKSNQKEVLVVSVNSLASDYYMQDTNLEGTITTNVAQNVTVDDDMVVEEVFVQKGDTVKEGDKLVSFDMTLVEMELNIAKLKKQQQEQNLTKAVNRLTSLKNGGPIMEDSDSLDADSLSDMGSLTSSLAGVNGSFLAAVMHPILAVAVDFDVFGDGNAEDGDVSSGENDSNISDSPEPTQSPVDNGTVLDQPEDTGNSGDVIVDSDEFSSGAEFESGISDSPDQIQSAEPESDETVEIFGTEPDAGVEGVFDGDPIFYLKLNSNSEPFAGTGTEEDPYIFLCSNAKGKVIVDGSFFNKMAGYSEDGTKIVKEGGYWYQLEFHKNDTITNYLDRKESCIGYYLMDGSVMEGPVNMYAQLELTQADAATDEEELGADNYGGGLVDMPGSSSSGTSLSREDAIKMQESQIASLKLDIQESDINIGKLEKKVAKQVIYSKLDGVIANVGDAVTGTSDGEAFLSVRSEEGFYVQGVVSELLLDQIEEGTVLNCTSYESGSFEAEVVDISDYPVSSDSYYGYGSGNPNVSYYSFSATITDDSVQVSDQEWLTITMSNSCSSGDVIVLSKAFVRSEGGVNYVYKDDQGVLKRQNLTVGGTVDGGYSVLVKGGITREDKIAFPYGDAVQEGAKTKEGTVDELYGY